MQFSLHKLDAKKDPNALLRLFAISAIFSFLVILSFAGYGLREMLQRYVISDAESNAIDVSSALLAEERENIVLPRKDGGFALGVRPNDLPRLDRHLRLFLAPFDIIKIKIYSSEYRIIYSTETKLIGRLDTGNVRLGRALAGHYDSKFEKKEEVRDLAQEMMFDVDVVETYIPILDNSDNVIGSFEVYLDVTKYREMSRKAVALFLGFLALVLLIVYGGSFPFIRKGTRDLKGIQEMLRKQTLTDPLTGISNKRHILLSAQKEFARASRKRKRGLPDVDMGLVMLDVDRFKQVNDSYGHLAGDVLLKGLAERITSSLRTYDTVGRFGGEEFLVVLPASDLEQSLRVAHKIWTLVREEPFLLEGKRVPVTVSLGVAASREGDTEYGEILKRADDALYRAKSAGRDRVVLEN